MPQRHVSRLIALPALLLAVGGCDSTATTTTTTPPSDPACPVTLPTPGDFVPPAPYPATYPSQDFVWYGEAGLWTVLDPDGGYQPRKSVWWSEQFPGGDVEERPALHVTHRRIAEPDVPIIDNEGNATNAYTVDDGWFMIATIEPDEPGCWQVDASYKGATLSYVYLVPEADE